MASGTGSHQQQKISPRKFSEKIALLNKSEREGNAKFEEIIKEVQATRNHQQTNQNQYQPQQHVHIQHQQHHQHHEHNQQQQQQQQQLQPVASTFNAPYVEDVISQVLDTVPGHDSQYYEEIEEVYDDLLRTVGQYDQDLEQQQQRQNQSLLTNEEQRKIDDKPAYRSASAGVECKLDQQQQQQPITHSPSSSMIPSNAFNSYNQQQVTSGINQQTATNENNRNDSSHDLNDQQLFNRNREFIPCDPSSKSSFSGQSISNTSASILTSQSQHNQQQLQQHLEFIQPTRPRVISFGSATNYRYTAANNAVAAAAAAAAAATAVNSNQQQRYLADQALWTASGHHNQNQDYLNEPTQRQKSCSDPALHVLPPDNSRYNEPNNNTQFNHHLGPTNLATEVPGIKICAIEDDLENSQQQTNPRGFTNRLTHSNNNMNINNNQSSSRECSLPDISNLQFDQELPMDSASTSPIKQLDHIELSNRTSFNPDSFQDSCQALDGSWASNVGCPTLRQQQQQDINSCQPAGICRIFSHSDYGLTSSHNHHVGGGGTAGGLMICPSGDSIVRSRSHSNIDYLAKQTMIHHQQQQQQQQQPIGSSSSNLNSPQSDLNSPGSSTNEYCDPSLMYQLANPPGCCAPDDTTTLVPVDANQYLIQDNPPSSGGHYIAYGHQNLAQPIESLTSTTTSSSISPLKLRHNHHNQQIFSQK